MDQNQAPAPKETRQSKRQTALLAAGMCVTCGREKLVTKRHCLKCAAAQRERMRIRSGCVRRYMGAKTAQAEAKKSREAIAAVLASPA